MGDLSVFNKLFADVCETEEKPSVINEALGLTNNVQKQMQPLQRIVNVTGLHPMQGQSTETTDTVGKKSLFTGNEHAFPYPLDAIEDPMRRTAKGIQDMIDIFRECREGLITPAQRDICDEYVEFFQTLLREVFKKRMCLDLTEIGGK